ncbi:hypothetical protein AOLI_G00127940 [Acnodon oligacanthus]
MRLIPGPEHPAVMNHCEDGRESALSVERKAHALPTDTHHGSKGRRRRSRKMTVPARTPSVTEPPTVPEREGKSTLDPFLNPYPTSLPSFKAAGPMEPISVNSRIALRVHFYPYACLAISSVHSHRLISANH